METRKTIVEQMNLKGSAICRLPGSEQWGLFTDPTVVLSTCSHDKVTEEISKLEEFISQGKYAAGFISYEAAPAFDNALKVKENELFPLCWFAVYDAPPTQIDLPNSDYTLAEHFLRPKISKERYGQSINTILGYINKGDIYQANNTIRAFGDVVGSPAELYLSLTQSHPVPYSSFVNTGEHQIVSISPELFMEKTGTHITSHPMKGTASRSPIKSDDEAIAKALAKDEKNCAENVMIVDMVRNDFGRICVPSSITVDPLFHVDTYQTLHQMISKVHGTLPNQSSLLDILTATFPAASITGAPKVRAMEVIDELECSPRKVYTGSMGCFIPGGDFCLNVAIRTLICSSDHTELGIGSGIVADSTAHSEWDECLLKSEFASHKPISFDILETLVYNDSQGIILVDEHLKRAADSQNYFGRPYNEKYLTSILDELISDLKAQSVTQARIRLLINKDGLAHTEWTELPATGWSCDTLKIAISNKHTSSNDLFLYHKTTNRSSYNEAFKHATESGFDEVVFFNEREELTEGSISNIFLKIEDQWLTPQLNCGLLPGIWRAQMISQLNAKEAILTEEDLRNADSVLIGNSVRGTRQVKTVTRYGTDSYNITQL